MKLIDDKIIFESTGREEYCFMNIIGIDPSLQTFYGSDGDMGGCESPKFTDSERQELADYMIELWTTYKRKHA